jgi:hypothetical protein
MEPLLISRPTRRRSPILTALYVTVALAAATALLSALAYQIFLRCS